LPRSIRPAFAALWNLDLALAGVVATSSDVRLGAIRLAWWREQLQHLDQDGEGPAEPRLQSVAKELIPRSITGEELSQLEDAWLPLLGPFPWASDHAEGLRERGRILFGVGARLLGAAPEIVQAAGALWSLVDGAQHCSDPQSRIFLLNQAREDLAALQPKMPRAVRGLTILAALGAADLVGEGRSSKRLSAAIRHKLTGALPR